MERRREVVSVDQEVSSPIKSSRCVWMYSMPPSFAIFLLFRLHRRLQEDLRAIIVTPRYMFVIHTPHFILSCRSKREKLVSQLPKLDFGNFFQIRLRSFSRSHWTFIANFVIARVSLPCVSFVSLWLYQTLIKMLSRRRSRLFLFSHQRRSRVEIYEYFYAAIGLDCCGYS